MRDWWSDRLDGDYGFFWFTGAFLASVIVLVAAVVAFVMHYDRVGCDRIEVTQQVETEYHWTTGCIYVDPDYIVGNS